MANYSQVQVKPSAAYRWSLLGSIMGILVALYLIGNAFTVDNYFIFFGLGIWVLVASVVIIYAAQKLNSKPTEHSKWGAIILIFSIISLGGLLSIIGGILALVYKPQFEATSQQTWRQQVTPQQNSIMQVGTQICSQCGQVTDTNARFCPDCGSSTFSKPQIQSPTHPLQTSSYGPQIPEGNPTQFCGNCGNRLAPEARFCNECGQPTQ